MHSMPTEHRKTADTMELKAKSQKVRTLDEGISEVLALLQRPKSSVPAFTAEQLDELKKNSRIRIGSYDSGYSYTTALNHIAQGRPGVGHSGGTKSLSLMIWDLLQSDELKGKRELKRAARMLHGRTGSFVREAKVSNPMDAWILENSDVLMGSVEFITQTPELKNLGASSKQEIQLRYSCCGTEASTSCIRFAAKVKSHRKHGTPVKCADCAKSLIPVRTYFGKHAQILDDSGVRMDRVTEEQFELPSGSSEEMEIFFGCHEDYVLISPESLKSKIQRARNMNHAQIACNDCSVTQGKIESKAIAFLEGNAATTNFLKLPSATISNQFRIPSIENMPFDTLVTAADGTRTLIEVDGGFHYDNRDLDALDKKIESDRLKTEIALSNGYNLIRIDERNLVRLTVEIQELLLRATVGAVERYTVIGQECPGAALVSDELKYGASEIL